MNDNEIIELYNQRSETAIDETKKKYHSYLMTIADNILYNKEDSEECVSDTYLKTWNAIPPTVPTCLQAFLGKITRNVALNKLRNDTRQKRAANKYYIQLDELDNILRAEYDIESKICQKQMLKIIDMFLADLPIDKRIIFVRRYWYFDSIKDISKRMNISESNVKITLKRQRDTLKKILNKEGYL